MKDKHDKLHAFRLELAINETAQDAERLGQRLTGLQDERVSIAKKGLVGAVTRKVTEAQEKTAQEQAEKKEQADIIETERRQHRERLARHAEMDGKARARQGACA